MLTCKEGPEPYVRILCTYLQGKAVSCTGFGFTVFNDPQGNSLFIHSNINWMIQSKSDKNEHFYGLVCKSILPSVQS